MMMSIVILMKTGFRARRAPSPRAEWAEWAARESVRRRDIFGAYYLLAHIEPQAHGPQHTFPERISLEIDRH